MPPAADYITLLAQRWPTCLAVMQQAEVPGQIESVQQGNQSTLCVDGIHISSLYDPQAEAKLQATLIPDSCRTATVYGIGNGELIRSLLARPGLEKLRVVILNPGIEYNCLAQYCAPSWLADPRLELLLARDEVTIHSPFVALPAALRLASDEAARLRDKLLLELNTPYIRENFRARASEFNVQMQANEKRIAQDGDVAILFATHKGSTIAVAAAGPSLALQYTWLKSERKNMLLIAVDAALNPLLQAGIQPDIVVTIDGLRSGILPYFSGDLQSMRDKKLVYFPIVHPDVLDCWPGERLVAYAEHEIYRAMAQRYPKGHLFASGTVTHAATDLAVQMGAKRVIFCGADFGFPDGSSHVQGSAHASRVGTNSGSAWVLNGQGKRIATLPNLRAYLRDLESYIARQPQVEFYNTSRQGAHIEGVNYLIT